MDLNNTVRVNARLLSPASYELFEELNIQLQGGCPVDEICSFLQESEWQESLNTSIRPPSPAEDDELMMEVYQGGELKGKA